MRGINFKKQGASFKIIHKGDEDLSLWTFTLDDGLKSIDSPSKDVLVDDMYMATIDCDDEDYWLLVKWGTQTEMIMVGDAEVISWMYSGTTDATYNYRQIALDDGDDLKNEDMLEAGEGFYYIEPEIEQSVAIFNDSLIATLTIPYIVINVDDNSGSEVSGDKTFINVGFNMFGFIGERHSYFDLDNGEWVNDDNMEAKASDLAKAVCYKYSLVWDNEDDDKYIGKYIKYIRSYTENDGKVRYYKPYKTPEDNDANFSLMQTDEDDNLVVKGVSILLLQTLETINDTDGAIITFK